MHKHYIANKYYYASKTATYRAKMIQAIPKWEDINAIHELYCSAKELTEKTGMKMEVDHIIPLNGKHVTGLHVENNLRVIPATLNRSKGNRVHMEI